MSKSWRVRALIDAAAFSHNLQQAQKLAANSQVMAVVKANAYGHGVAVLANALANASSLAVIDVAEAKTLRAAGLEQNIVILQGLQTESQAQWCANNSAEPVIVNRQQVMLMAACISRGMQWPRLWLKLDTGMHSLGVNPVDVNAAIDALSAAGFNGTLAAMTHFACADESASFTKQQIACFDAAVKAQLLQPQSLANSAAIFDYKQSHRNVVRPGIMLYGSSPFANRSAAELGLKAVMTLQARVVAVHCLSAAEAVGYGLIWQAQTACKVAVVSAGYGDGLPRNLPAGTAVDVNGLSGEIVGRVSMDSCFVMLENNAEVAVGDVATFWGQTDAGRLLPVDERAQACGTIAYELLTRITARVPRVLRGSENG